MTATPKPGEKVSFRAHECVIEVQSLHADQPHAKMGVFGFVDQYGEDHFCEDISCQEQEPEWEIVTAGQIETMIRPPANPHGRAR